MSLAGPSDFFSLLPAPGTGPKLSYTKAKPVVKANGANKTSEPLLADAVTGTDKAAPSHGLNGVESWNGFKDVRNDNTLNRVENGNEPRKNDHSKHRELKHDSGTLEMASLTRAFNLEEQVKQLVARVNALEMKSRGPMHQSKPSLGAGPGPVVCAHDFQEDLNGLGDISTASSPTGSEATPDRYMPLTIRNLAPYTPALLAQTPLALSQLETFPLSLLKTLLGGKEWSPGFHCSATKSTISKYPRYYLLDRAVEPYLPLAPGTHGAKLSLFFNELDEPLTTQYANVPLFISHSAAAAEGAAAAEPAYVYFGQYSQPRWSDKLDCDRGREVVPRAVKAFWAGLLTARDRPEWLTEAVVEHFWPKPGYVGRMGEGVAVEKDVAEYVAELAEWEKEARMKVMLLKEENVMAAFDKEDATEEPGLRFWWEYLQCVGFDRSFYYMLATEKKKGVA